MPEPGDTEGDQGKVDANEATLQSDRIKVAQERIPAAPKEEVPEFQKANLELMTRLQEKYPLAFEVIHDTPRKNRPTREALVLKGGPHEIDISLIGSPVKIDVLMTPDFGQFFVRVTGPIGRLQRESSLSQLQPRELTPLFDFIAQEHQSITTGGAHAWDQVSAESKYYGNNFYLRKIDFDLVKGERSLTGELKRVFQQTQEKHAPQQKAEAPPLEASAMNVDMQKTEIPKAPAPKPIDAKAILEKL